MTTRLTLQRPPSRSCSSEGNTLVETLCIMHIVCNEFLGVLRAVDSTRTPYGSVCRAKVTWNHISERMT
jgi:hypothetical protein